MIENIDESIISCFVCGGTGRASGVIQGSHLSMDCPACKGYGRLSHRMTAEHSDNGVVFTFSFIPAKPESPHDS